MSKSTSKLFQDETTISPNEAVSEKLDKAPVMATQEPAPQEEATEDIQDVDIKSIKKQRFRFNHDNSMILELNTSDLGILARLTTAYNELNELMEEVGKVISESPDDDSAESYKTISETLDKLDKDMRNKLDFIFDAPVSEVLGRDGSMYDPIDGMFRYEHIIDVLVDKYENNLSREFTKMRNRVNHATSKYTKKYHK